MKIYRVYYRIIGLIIAIVGGVITPFIPKLISGDVPNDINVYVLYLLNISTLSDVLDEAVSKLIICANRLSITV